MTWRSTRASGCAARAASRVPAGVGQPTLLIDGLTVGGTGGEPERGGR